MNKKSQYISLRINELERAKIEALKGRSTISHTIRKLIRESSPEGFKTPVKTNENIPLEQQERLISDWVESLT